MNQALPRLLGPPLYDKGVEAAIWEHPEDPTSLIKVYRSNLNIDPGKELDRRAFLDYLQAISGQIRPSDWFLLNTCTSWVNDVYSTTESNVVGLRIPKANEDFYVRIVDQFGPEVVPQELSYLISNAFERPGVQEVPYRDIGFHHRLEIALSAARIIEALWRNGLTFTDISARNILWTINRRPRAFFIDIESASPINQLGNRSPDWYPPSRLGYTLEANRSQAALLIWRIFDRQLRSSPFDEPSSIHAKRLTKQSLQLLKGAWQTGETIAWSELVAELDMQRSEDFRQIAIEEAKQTGFARLILTEIGSSDHFDDLKRCAQQQLETEREYAQKTPSDRTLPQRLLVTEPGFEFDLLPQAILSKDRFDVYEALLKGEYQRILDVGSNGPDVAIPEVIIEHCVQVLMRNTHKLDTRIQNLERNRFEISWSWPNIEFVNRAVVRVTGVTPGDLGVQTIARKSGIGRIALNLDGLGLKSVQLEVSLLSSLQSKSSSRPFAQWSDTLAIRELSQQSEGIKTMEYQPRPQVPLQPKNAMTTESVRDRPHLIASNIPKRRYWLNRRRNR